MLCVVFVISSKHCFIGGGATGQVLTSWGRAIQYVALQE